MLLEAMLAHLSAMLGYVGPAGRHLEATWRQDEAQERQDEARWRTRAPRRGKIAELRRWGPLQGECNPRDDTRGPPLHPPKNGFSRMGLQTPTPAGTGSGKLEDWKTGRLEDWAFGFTLYTQLCLRHGGGYIYICIYIYIYCLLYTSPSPRDGLLSRMKYSA